jgi:hypothetical protein
MAFRDRSITKPERSLRLAGPGGMLTGFERTWITTSGREIIPAPSVT